MAQQVQSQKKQRSNGKVNKHLINQLRLGDVVLVSGHRLAIVRFVGNVEFEQGTWIGVELKGHRDLHHGCDGTKNGKKYFETKHNKAGLFVENIIRVIPPEELLHKVAELNEKLLLCTCGANEIDSNGNSSNMNDNNDNNDNNDSNDKNESNDNNLNSDNGKKPRAIRQNTYGGQIDYDPSSSEEDA